MVNAIYSRIFFNYKLTKLFSIEKCPGAKDSAKCPITIIYYFYYFAARLNLMTVRLERINRNKHSETL